VDNLLAKMQAETEQTEAFLFRLMPKNFALVAAFGASSFDYWK
jgi:hypothetical protein